jgi:hypothetical protein
MKRNEEREELKAILEGKGYLKHIFMNKNDKINRITELTSSINAAGLDIECLGLLHKIIVL